MNEEAVFDGHSVLSLSGRREKCWNVAGCSLPGAAHLRKCRDCEDSFGWFIDGDLLCIAVADGAGSAAEAALGSALAVHTAITTVMEMRLAVRDVTTSS